MEHSNLKVFKFFLLFKFVLYVLQSEEWSMDIISMENTFENL